MAQNPLPGDVTRGSASPRSGDAVMGSGINTQIQVGINDAIATAKAFSGLAAVCLKMLNNVLDQI